MKMRKSQSESFPFAALSAHGARRFEHTEFNENKKTKHKF